MPLLELRTSSSSDTFSEIMNNQNHELGFPGWCELNMRSKWTWVIQKEDFSICCFYATKIAFTDSTLISQYIHLPATTVSTDNCS